MSFPFDPAHKSASTHTQVLNSKFLLPKLAGKGPPRFTNTQCEKKLRSHAQYMCALFVPWSPHDVPNRDSASKQWKSHVDKLREGNAYERCKFRCAQNIARGLNSSDEIKSLLNGFRFSQADSRKESGKNLADDVVDDECTAEELADAIKRKLPLLRAPPQVSKFVFLFMCKCKRQKSQTISTRNVALRI